MDFPLNQYGYIDHYLISGAAISEFECGFTDENQLRYEKKARKVIARHEEDIEFGTIKVGEMSRLLKPWEYYYSYGNWFVDRSDFYPLLKKVELDAVTILCSAKELDAGLTIWSYAAVDIWVNGEYIRGIEAPVYKPIQRKSVTVHLNEGRNLLYVRLQNLGVRDTRTLFGLQMEKEYREKLSVSLPDEEHISGFAEVERWLSGLRVEEKDGLASVLCSGSIAPRGARIVYDTQPIDFTEYEGRFITEDIAGKERIELNRDIPYFEVEVPILGQVLKRKMEQLLAHKTAVAETSGREENWNRVYKRLASVKQIPRMDHTSFSMYPILARYERSCLLPQDEAEIYKSLDQIESRMDCSDFVASGLLRLLKLYPVEEALGKRCREVFLNYRYWMDQEGSDGMCFWSENHSLLFFGCAYIAGQLYPDDLFSKSGMTGRELKELSGIRLYDWLKDALEIGFDEFNSGGYAAVTFAGLLNVIDFCEEELSEMASRAADALLKSVAVQCFHGVNISPMGRVYREVLYPMEQDIQALIQLIDPAAPDKFCEWISPLFHTRYRLPYDLSHDMKEELSLIYPQANALISLEKRKNYILTSVQSPRNDGIVRTWEPIKDQELGSTVGTFRYVKSLNECFHGTTQFEPGVYGYQQHMWYAALANDTLIFVNHPGTSCDAASMRPGYWFGNGIMPLLAQRKNILYCIYQIPEKHPISFTHLFWPGARMDEQAKEDGWIAGRKNDGYAAVWCSQELTEYDDQLSGCEYRANGRSMAYLCVCADRDEYAYLESFLKGCKALVPLYDQNRGVLYTSRETFHYVPRDQATQYV